MHVLLIRNRDAGSADEMDPARLLVDRGCTVTDADIEEAARWERSPAPSLRSVERVIVAGGDGSLGPAASLAHQLAVPLGVVPAGTANDFARALDLPADLEQACLLAATGTRTRPVDIAFLNGRPFVNVASFGIAPRAADEAASLKRVLRAFAYPVGALLGLAQATPVGAVATVDGELAWSGSARQVMIAASGAFGGWAEAGEVRHGDGKIDLVVVPRGRGVGRGVVDAAHLLTGDLTRRAGIVHLRGAQIVLELRRATQVVVDGELLELAETNVTARAGTDPVQLVVG